MKNSKDFVVLQKERYTANVSCVIEDIISFLRRSATEKGIENCSCVGETLLLMMFAAELEDRIFGDDQTTENMDNESEVTL